MEEKQICPICGKGHLTKVAGNSLTRAFVLFLFLTPAWLIAVIWGQIEKKYKCSVCGKTMPVWGINQMNE